MSGDRFDGGPGKDFATFWGDGHPGAIVTEKKGKWGSAGKGLVRGEV